MKKRLAAVLAAAVCLALAAALVALAADARRVERRLHEGDVELLTGEPGAARFSARTRLPATVVDALLATGDDRRFRRAARLFHRNHPAPRHLITTAWVSEGRARAELILGRERERGPEHRRAAAIANMLGILAIEDAVAEPNQARPLVEAAIRYFRDAIRLDGDSADAKYNLEFLLSGQPPGLPQGATKPGPRKGEKKDAVTNEPVVESGY